MRGPRLEDAARLLSDIAGEVYDGSEYVAGLGGRREAERLRAVIESRLPGRAWVSRVPVTAWRLRHAEVSVDTEWLVVPPYSPSGAVEGRAVRIEGDPSEASAWRGPARGAVAVVDPPGDPDDLKAVALHAWEAGYEAVVMALDTPRIIVGTGVWGYSYHAGAPMPVPVVGVPRSGAARLVDGWVRVEVESSLEDSVGYNVFWGWGEDMVVAGAHYDRWYHGYQDDMLGVAQAVASAVLLEEQGASAGVALFTAEEHGAPGPAGWYWAWGSRWHAQQLSMKDADRIRLYVNYDLAGSTPLVIGGAPQHATHALHALRALGIEARPRWWECPECDSMSLATIGVPTVTIHTLWNDRVRGYYHTPRDTPETADHTAAAAAVVAGVRAGLEAPDYGALAERLASELGPGPLPARMILETIARRAPAVGWGTAYRILASRWLRPYHVGDYRLDGPAELGACMFPEACVLRDPRTPRVLAVWEPGVERLLYSPRGRLWEQARQRLHELLWEVREALGGG